MTPSFEKWTSGVSVGFFHEPDGKGAEEAHELAESFVKENPEDILVETADKNGFPCKEYPNRYESPDNSDDDSDSEAKRYQKYWKRILRSQDKKGD